MPNITELGTIQIDGVDEYGDRKINGILDAGFLVIVPAGPGPSGIQDKSANMAAKMVGAGVL